MIKRLLGLIPEHHIYIEPFCGGAGLLFAKEPAKVEVINDLNGELINFFQAVKYQRDQLLDSFGWLLHSRRWFNELAAQDPVELDSIQRAVRFFYLQKGSYGALGRHFSTSKITSEARYLLSINDVITAAHHRLISVTVEEMDFAECIKRYDHPDAFIYLDPPYLNAGDRLYVKCMAEGDFVRLRDVLERVHGNWLLSHADNQFIRTLFKQYEILDVSTKYSLAGGKNKKSISRIRKELLIANYSMKR